MRLSSVTLPSCIGTLKSTRMRTRLPLRSMSFTVFLFMGAPTPTHTLPKFLEFGEGWGGGLKTLCHHRRKISSAAGVTPFIVVPCNDLGECALVLAEHHCERQINR